MNIDLSLQELATKLAHFKSFSEDFSFLAQVTDSYKKFSANDVATEIIRLNLADKLIDQKWEGREGFYLIPIKDSQGLSYEVFRSERGGQAEREVFHSLHTAIAKKVKFLLLELRMGIVAARFPLSEDG